MRGEGAWGEQIAPSSARYGEVVVQHEGREDDRGASHAKVAVWPVRHETIFGGGDHLVPVEPDGAGVEFLTAHHRRTRRALQATDAITRRRDFRPPSPDGIAPDGRRSLTRCASCLSSRRHEI